MLFVLWDVNYCYLCSHCQLLDFVFFYNHLHLAPLHPRTPWHYTNDFIVVITIWRMHVISWLSLYFKGNSYVLEASKNPTKVFDCIAQLLAHPLQRPLQQELNYSLLLFLRWPIMLSDVILRCYLLHAIPDFAACLTYECIAGFLLLCAGVWFYRWSKTHNDISWRNEELRWSRKVRFVDSI